MATGMGAGFASGLFGVGGGTIIVPILIIYFSTVGIVDSVLVHCAVATSLAAITIGILSSALSHYRHQGLSWTHFFLLAPGMAVGVVIGAVMVGYSPALLLRIMVATLLLLVGLKMLFNWQPKHNKTSDADIGSMFAAGTAVGFISAFTGVGGGGLTVPFLDWRGVPIHRAVGVSAMCGVIISGVGTLMYIQAPVDALHDIDGYLGYVNVPAAILIGLTAALFAPLGAKLAHAMHERRLSIIFSVFLISGSLVTLLSY